MSDRRNRSRRPGRREPFQDSKPIILIVCEGEKTEPQYFDGFRKAYRNPRVDIEICSEHGVPLTLVKIAKRRKQERREVADRERDENIAYDSVWCVFDVDDHPQINEAKQMAKTNEIDLAISNPCFELWLILHFRNNPGMQHRDRLREIRFFVEFSGCLRVPSSRGSLAA